MDSLLTTDTNLHDYVYAFVVGSSLPMTVLPFLMSRFLVENRNYDDCTYMFMVPLYFGALAVLSLFMKRRGMLNDTKQIIATAGVGALVTLAFTYNTGAYDFDTVGWIQYSIVLLLMYLAVFFMFVKDVLPLKDRAG